MKFRAQLQINEALSSLNRYFCSKAHGRQIDDPELLGAYFIKSGGAKNFAARFNQAMGDQNRWFCSEYFGYEIRDEETLWNWYVEHYRTRAAGCSVFAMELV